MDKPFIFKPVMMMYYAGQVKDILQVYKLSK